MNLPPFLPEADSPRAIPLPPHGTTTAAEELHVHLVLAADAGAPVRIDASAVESVGQAVLQLLIAARTDFAAAGRPFAIEDPSDAFVERVARCGLAGALGLELEGVPA